MLIVAPASRRVTRSLDSLGIDEAPVWGWAGALGLQIEAPASMSAPIMSLRAPDAL